MAAQQLHIGALGVGREYALRSPFEAIELAGDQRLERKLVVLELRNFDLEALFLRKVARRYHQEDAGVGFRVDQAMLPDLFLCDAGSNQAGQCRGSRMAVSPTLRVFMRHPPWHCALTASVSRCSFGTLASFGRTARRQLSAAETAKPVRAVQCPRAQPL